MTRAQFEGLHVAISKTRPSTPYVKVEAQALLHLLADYSRLMSVAEALVVLTPEEGESGNVGV